MDQKPTQTFEENESATFKCTASGYPKPVMTWHIGDRPVPTSSELVVEKPGRNGLWVVSTEISMIMSRENAGSLRCEGANGVEPMGNATMDLIVKCKCRCIVVSETLLLIQYFQVKCCS